MLALTFIQYWWLRPRIQDPHDLSLSSLNDLKAKNLSSIMDPLDAPQYDIIKNWSKISSDILDPVQRTMAEIEKALVEGKDLILIERSIASHAYAHYISHGWLLQENTMYYGGIGLLVSYFFPKMWFIYIPASLLALIHSWMYFRVYKYDRLSQYQGYDDDRHPVSNLVTAFVLGQRPHHFHYVLKKERVIVWEIISELVMYSSVISSLFSLKSIKETVVGDKYISTDDISHPLSELLSLPAYSSGYFQPPELMPVALGCFLPADIPYVKGWFDMPWFNFRFKSMKLDLAIIICGVGGYFVYKMFQHFFCYGDDKTDGATREWLNNEANQFTAPSCTSNTNLYWVKVPGGGNEALMETDMIASKSDFSAVLQKQEEKMIERITSKVPYGWVPPGYSENHYGAFT